ncbi:MAG: hypothetical protein ACOCWJ_06220 [Verrucomicrobiota bacterium]
MPLLMKRSANEHAGRTVDQPVSLLDIAPTMLEAAGVEAYAQFDGESLEHRLAPDDPGRVTPL